MNNLELLDNIANTADKTQWDDMVTGKAILNAEQQTTFLREFQIADPVLTMARMVYMQNPSRETSLFQINGRVSQAGYVNGNRDTTKNPLTAANLKFTGQEIVTTKIKAKAVLTDDELEENIERQTLQQTVLSEMGYKMGLDQAYWNLFGDSTITPTKDDLLCAGDGWIKSATNQIKSTGVDSTHGTVDMDNGVDSLFDAMKQALPPEFRTQQLVCFVPYEIEDAYRNFVIKRETQLGDSNLPNWNGLTYKGIPIIHSPTLDDSVAQELDNTATCLLSSTSNLEYNIFKDITVEMDRDVEAEINKFIFKYKSKPSLQRKDGAVVAKISLKELAEIQENSKRKPVYVKTVTSKDSETSP